MKDPGLFVLAVIVVGLTHLLSASSLSQRERMRGAPGRVGTTGIRQSRPALMLPLRGASRIHLCQFDGP